MEIQSIRHKTDVLAVLALTIGWMNPPAFGHHSFTAEYDRNQPVRLEGTVTKLELMNPHARLYITVKDEKGVPHDWELELGPPSVLIHGGWTRTTLKAGDQVIVEGYRAKDQSNLANARFITLPDGRRVFGGSSADGGPAK